MRISLGVLGLQPDAVEEVGDALFSLITCDTGIRWTVGKTENPMVDSIVALLYRCLTYIRLRHGSCQASSHLKW